MENQREGKAICDGFGGGSGGGGAGGGGDGGLNTNHPPPRPCPRCQSSKTKFCYFNNYSLSQPRYYCKECRRYWTQGGTLRNVPVGGGCRKRQRSKMDPSTSAAPPMLPQNYLHHQTPAGTTALGGASGSGGGGRVGNMLFGVRESTNTAGAFGSSFVPMTQQSPLNVGSNSLFMNGFTMSGYSLNNPLNQLRNQLFQNVYSITEVGSSSTSAAPMGAEWNLSVQAAAPAPPVLFPETNNDNNNNNTNDADDDNDDELSRQWADYMGNNGLGGEP